MGHAGALELERPWVPLENGDCPSIAAFVVATAVLR